MQIIRRSLAGALSLVLFITNCALAHSPEVNFWKERQNHLVRHSRASGNPGRKPFSEGKFKTWIPAFAGMTDLSNLNAFGTIRKITFEPFDGKVTAYRTGTSTFGDYIRALSQRAPKVSTELRILLDALELEYRIDFLMGSGLPMHTNQLVFNGRSDPSHTSRGTTG